MAFADALFNRRRRPGPTRQPLSGGRVGPGLRRDDVSCLMTTETIASTAQRRGLLANPSYVRLWLAGGVGNAMRWLELLVAGIFTYDATHSAFLVAVVTVARSLPMLFLGPIAGVVAEAFNRKRLLLAQLALMTGTSS